MFYNREDKPGFNFAVLVLLWLKTVFHLWLTQTCVAGKIILLIQVGFPISVLLNYGCWYIPPFGMEVGGFMTQKTFCLPPLSSHPFFRLSQTFHDFCMCVFTHDILAFLHDIIISILCNGRMFVICTCLIHLMLTNN